MKVSFCIVYILCISFILKSCIIYLFLKELGSVVLFFKTRMGEGGVGKKCF